MAKLGRVEGMEKLGPSTEASVRPATANQRNLQNQSNRSWSSQEKR
jgi:hypothetical protein